MGRAAEVVKSEVCPREHLGGIEHSELEAGAQDAAEIDIDLGLGDEALGDGFHQGFVGGTAFYVRTGKHCVGGSAGGIRMSTVVVGTVEIVDGAAVGNDYSAESPFVAEDVLEQPVAGAAGLALIPVVCAHHFLHVAFLDDHPEGGEIGLPEVPHRY